MKMQEEIVLIAILVFLGLLVVLNSQKPFNAAAAVTFAGAANSFAHANPTATVSFTQGNSAFGQLQPIEPLTTGTPQSICQSKASVMFLGVNLGQDKETAQQLYPLVTIELYLDSVLQTSTRGGLEKYVDTTSPSTNWWYQFIEFTFFQQNALGLGTHTASSIVKFNAAPIFTGSDTFTVLNC